MIMVRTPVPQTHLSFDSQPLPLQLSLNHALSSGGVPLFFTFSLLSPAQPSVPFCFLSPSPLLCSKLIRLLSLKSPPLSLFHPEEPRGCFPLTERPSPPKAWDQLRAVSGGSPERRTPWKPPPSDLYGDLKSRRNSVASPTR